MYPSGSGIAHLNPCDFVAGIHSRFVSFLYGHTYTPSRSQLSSNRRPRGGVRHAGACANLRPLSLQRSFASSLHLPPDGALVCDCRRLCVWHFARDTSAELAPEYPSHYCHDLPAVPLSPSRARPSAKVLKRFYSYRIRPPGRFTQLLIS